MVSLCSVISRFRRFACGSFRRDWFHGLVICAAFGIGTLMPLPASATVVHMEVASGGVSVGTIDIQLYDDEAPITVANFLRYAGRGDYDGTVFHRSVDTSSASDPVKRLKIVQAGGIQFKEELVDGRTVLVYSSVVTDDPIPNEFSPLRPNVRGTIAMARLSGLHTATSGWFINVADNPRLDNVLENNVYAVFGRILDSGMDAVVDPIAAVPTYPPPDPSADPPASTCFVQLCAIRFFNSSINTSSYFYSDFPLVNYTYDSSNLPPPVPVKDNFVLISRVPNVRSAVVPDTRFVVATYTADPDIEFTLAEAMSVADATPLITQFPRPADTSVRFDLSVEKIIATGLGATANRTITMRDELNVRPTHYYAYGPTADNATPHWYDFSYDSVTDTGAEITATDIKLHFVDGQRGDDDLAANGTITHTGAPATIASIPASSKSSGCTLSVSPSTPARAGDWAVMALFLVVSAFARRAAPTTPPRHPPA